MMSIINPSRLILSNLINLVTECERLTFKGQDNECRLRNVKDEMAVRTQQEGPVTVGMGFIVHARG